MSDILYPEVRTCFMDNSKNCKDNCQLYSKTTSSCKFAIALDNFSISCAKIEKAVIEMGKNQNMSQIPFIGI